MVDNNENILVEYDYNNITIIDPNKIVDSNGVVKERLVKHENLVMYANLECTTLPRTKLAVGYGVDDRIQTIPIASINFLKPNNKTYLDTNYTNSFTGTKETNNQGTTTPVQNNISSVDKTNQYFVKQENNTGNKPSLVDTQLLGIISIDIKIDTSFYPTFTIILEDVKGRVMFEQGENSPYGAFMNLPYPMFILTLKGYYGKAIRYYLMLQDFNSEYNSDSGNFRITLKFYTYKYTMLTEVPRQSVYALPYMYQSKVKIDSRTTTPNGNPNIPTTEYSTSLGLEKLKEVYSSYKSKGLIPDDFPEITVNQLVNKFDLFVKNVLDEFVKKNLTPLTDVDTYNTQLINYQREVYYGTSPQSWFETYIDKTQPLVVDGGMIIYPLKKEYRKIDKSNQAKSKLLSIVQSYNEKLRNNQTFGESNNTNTNQKIGFYKINGQNIPSTITNSVNTIGLSTNDKTIDNSTFLIEPTIDRVLLEATLKRQNISGTTNENTEIIKKQIVENTIFFPDGTKQINYFKFSGETNTFVELTNKMSTEVKTKKNQIETDLTNAISELLKTSTNELGFVPNIRNVLAVLFANAEAFLRLMDNVHTNAWEVREEPDRLNAIINDNTKEASQENINYEGKKFIYPWPQMLEQTSQQDQGGEQFSVVYPGETKYVEKYKTDNPKLWPEVEFIEEYIRAVTESQEQQNDINAYNNQLTKIERVSFNPIEFPVNNQVFSNTEVIKFFYEIYERVLMNVFFSGLIRSNDFTKDCDIVVNSISESERLNVINGLSNRNPYLIQRLKEFAYNGNNFEVFLRNFSNLGTGESWQYFIRGIFTTNYIKNYTNNDNFSFFNNNIVNEDISKPLSIVDEDKFVEYVNESTTSNNYETTDTYPFTNFQWVKDYLANSQAINNINTILDTRKVIKYSKINKIVSNLESTNNNIKPFSNFIQNNITTPDSLNNYFLTGDLYTLKEFYTSRITNFEKQFYTEGNLNYLNYSGYVGNKQTVSMLNTPYFTNAIQDGVKKFRENNEYPFVSAAYLFLNSLPLATLREKYKTNNEKEDLNYIFTTLKKFAAVHKFPYAWILKYGSIWHRYKKYVLENVDILQNVWGDFNYIENYDPLTNNPNKFYTFTASTDIGVVDMVLQQNITIGTDTSTTINTGFYPKLINDFNVFLQGYEIIDDYTSTGIQNAIDTSGLTINYTTDSIISKNKGFDPSSPNRDLRIFPWSVYVNSLDGQNTFIIPSHGATINQTKNECFDPNTGQLKIEVLNNKSIFNGSTRGFWNAPNYGYFDNQDIKKPLTIDYIKQIFTNQSKQENFSLNGDIQSYSKISEIFSVFERNILDLFEIEFLNFSKSKYDFTPSKITNNNSVKNEFENFQLTISNLFKLEKITGSSSTDIIRNIRETQQIKVSETLDNFIGNNDIIFKYGNPSNFDKKLFYSFSNFPIQDPYVFGEYSIDTPNALPFSGGSITLVQSKTNYPNEWKQLETYIGFSEIPELQYTNNGSYITDFFIDLNIPFESTNIKNFAPIIKIYATQKLQNSSLNKQEFFNVITDYINKQIEFKNKIFDSLIIKIQNSLPNVEITPINFEKVVTSPQIKTELWETFKALNDKWISGMDLKNKTLFEDLLLLDRASRNIGDKVIINIEKFNSLMKSKFDDKVSIFSIINSILIDNNFVVMNLPSYVSFYGIQEPSKTSTPRNVGPVESANSLFGNFLNVDYNNSTPKLVCFYGNKPSEQPDISKNKDFRYNTDIFYLSKSNNPISEDQTNKKDYAFSNRVVGFNVDMGPQNQSIFKHFSVNQQPGLATSDTFNILNQLYNVSNNRKGVSQNISLFNLYKTRSYTCEVSMMGCATIQPMMYFNLRYVPMFYGPYLITEVRHRIDNGDFKTTFTGIRQSSSGLPKIDDYLAILRTNLLKITQDSIKKAQEEKRRSDNIIGQANNVATSAKDKDSRNYNNTIDVKCQPNSQYSTWQPTANNTTTTISFKKMKQEIVKQTSDTKLQKIIFSTFFIESGTNNQGFNSVQNNYAGISIDQNWGTNGDMYFNPNTFYCSTSNIPYATFISVEKAIEMLVKRWEFRTTTIENDDVESYTKFWVINSNAAEKRNIDVYEKMKNDNQLIDIDDKIKYAINTFNSI